MIPVDWAGGKHEFGLTKITKKGFKGFECVFGSLGSPGYALIEKISLVYPYEFSASKKR